MFSKMVLSVPVTGSSELPRSVLPDTDHLRHITPLRSPQKYLRT
jgi:hypothetical protein